MNVAEILTALGVGGILKTLVDYFIKWHKDRTDRKKAFTTVFKGINEVFHSLQLMLNNSKATRIVILRTTNGGGVPTLTGKLYSSVLYEVFKSTASSIKGKWQNQVLDANYMEMLYEMNKKGWLHVDVKKQNEENIFTLSDGILKNLYLKEKVVESWIFKIVERPNEYIYLAVNFQEKEENNPIIKELFRQGINQLQNIFKKNSKI